MVDRYGCRDVSFYLYEGRSFYVYGIMFDPTHRFYFIGGPFFVRETAYHLLDKCLCLSALQINPFSNLTSVHRQNYLDLSQPYLKFVLVSS